MAQIMHLFNLDSLNILTVFIDFSWYCWS